MPVGVTWFSITLCEWLAQIPVYATSRGKGSGSDETVNSVYPNGRRLDELKVT